MSVNRRIRMRMRMRMINSWIGLRDLAQLIVVDIVTVVIEFIITIEFNRSGIEGTRVGTIVMSTIVIALLRTRRRALDTIITEYDG